MNIKPPYGFHVQVAEMPDRIWLVEVRSDSTPTVYSTHIEVEHGEVPWLHIQSAVDNMMHNLDRWVCS